MLSAEYYCQDECDGELMSLSVEKYNELVRENKTFVVFINQDGCTTADRLRGYITDYGREAGIKAYQMMFSDMKETNLYETIKYYPSVAVISHGKVVSYLKADSDEDADYYNDYEAFKKWMNKNVVLRGKTD